MLSVEDGTLIHGAYTHLANSTGHKTATMAEPLLLTSGPGASQLWDKPSGGEQTLVLTCDSAH